MTPDLWQAIGMAAFLVVVMLLTADRGHDGIRPGQTDDSDVHRRQR